MSIGPRKMDRHTDSRTAVVWEEETDGKPSALPRPAVDEDRPADRRHRNWSMGHTDRAGSPPVEADLPEFGDLALHPPQDAIRLRAYQIWENAGRPQMRDLDFWLHAEKELIEDGKVAKR